MLFYTLAKSQACPEGNKRVAVILTNAFLDLNGHVLAMERSDLRELLDYTASSDRTERDEVLQEICRRMGPFVVVPWEGN